MRLRMRATASALVLICAASAGCGQKPAALQVSPTKVKLYGLERAQRLVARVLDRKGQPIPNAPSLNWSSSMPAVADVDGTGRVVSKKEGKAIIRVTLENLSAQVPVEVVDVKGVEVQPAAAKLVGAPGASLPLQVVVRDSKNAAVAVPVTWSSSDEKVATVSPDGLVTSLSQGKAVILAKVGDLQTGAEVLVDPRPIGRVVLLPATALVHAGDSQHYQVLVYGLDGKEIEGASARFSSSNPDVVSVDATGIATGRRNGAATVRAEVGSRTAESTIIVN